MSIKWPMRCWEYQDLGVFGKDWRYSWSRFRCWYPDHGRVYHNGSDEFMIIPSRNTEILSPLMTSPQVKQRMTRCIEALEAREFFPRKWLDPLGPSVAEMCQAVALRLGQKWRVRPFGSAANGFGTKVRKVAVQQWTRSQVPEISKNLVLKVTHIALPVQSLAGCLLVQFSDLDATCFEEKAEEENAKLP